jgi:formamidopyrimidine-DNA glycosylase
VPELPEVESIRRRLESLVVGRTIERVSIGDLRLVQPSSPAEVASALTGRKITALERRGKYLVVGFESGLALLAHLRMTGSFRLGDRKELEDDGYRRAVIEFDDGSALSYRDVRRFGTWRLLGADELEGFLAERLGPEPLSADFTPGVLGERLSGRRTPIKAALLDQRTIAGLGNIYVDEALWRARVHPARRAGGLGKATIARLHDGICAALEEGIERQGATLRDYALPAGERGSMQNEFRVYGRDGEPCGRCGNAISKKRIAGRGTWFCPRCQKRRP